MQTRSQTRRQQNEEIVLQNNENEMMENMIQSIDSVINNVGGYITDDMLQMIIIMTCEKYGINSHDTIFEIDHVITRHYKNSILSQSRMNVLRERNGLA